MGQGQVAKLIGHRQEIWIEAIQNRIGLTSSVLRSMQGLKMTGAEEPVALMVQKLRLRELAQMAGFRWLIIWLNIFGKSPAQLLTVR